MAKPYTRRCLLVGLCALGAGPACEEFHTYYHEGERIRLTVTERVNTWRGQCVPLEVGDVVDLTIGEFDDHDPCDYEGSYGCTQAPLELTPPEFATNGVSKCRTGTVAQPLHLSCNGEREAGCRPTLQLRVSPIIRRGQKRADKGYLIVRWNLDEGRPDDAGVIQPCLDGCEESFRVRIDMLDR